MEDRDQKKRWIYLIENDMKRSGVSEEYVEVQVKWKLMTIELVIPNSTVLVYFKLKFTNTR